MLRNTALSLALASAATKADRPASIARNILWKFDNTKTGIVYEPAIRRPAFPSQVAATKVDVKV